MKKRRRGLIDTFKSLESCMEIDESKGNEKYEQNKNKGYSS